MWWNVIRGQEHDKRPWPCDGSLPFLMKREKTGLKRKHFSFRYASYHTSTTSVPRVIWGMGTILYLSCVCRWGSGVGGGGGWLSRSSCPYRSQACLVRSHSTDLTGPRQTSTASYTSSMYRSVHLPTPIVYPHDFLMLLPQNTAFISLHLTW